MNQYWGSPPKRNAATAAASSTRPHPQPDYSDVPLPKMKTNKTKIPRTTGSPPHQDYSDVPLPKMKSKRSRSPRKTNAGDILGLEEILSITKATQEIRDQLDLDLETNTGEPPALRFENRLLLIIDTNFAISHLSLLKELAALGERYGHILIVPWAVIKELDGLKNSGKVEYRNRAGAVSTGDTDLDMSLGLRARMANAWIFEQLGARSQSLFGQKVSERLGESTKGDDAILDCCRYFQHKADAFVVILSDDKNLCMKALIHEIMTVSYQEGMTAETIARITADEYAKNMGEMMDMDMEMDTETGMSGRPQQNHHLAPPARPIEPTPPPRQLSPPSRPLPKHANVSTYTELEPSKRKRDPKTPSSTGSGDRQLKSRKVAPGGLVSRHSRKSSTNSNSPPDTKPSTPTPQRPPDAPPRKMAPLPSRHSGSGTASASTSRATDNPPPVKKPANSETIHQRPHSAPQQAAQGPRKFEHIDDPKIENPDQLLPELEKVVFKVLRMAVAFQAPNSNVNRATSIGSVSDIMEQLRSRELIKFQFPNLRSVRPGSKAPAPERLAFLRGLMNLAADMEKSYTGEYPKNYVEAVGWVLGLVNSGN